MVENNKNEIALSRELIFVFDALYATPNGDRNPHALGNRVDPETDRAIVSDLRIKRTIRDYFLRNSSLNNEKIMVRRSLVFGKMEKSLKNVFLEDLGIENEKDIKNLTDQQISDLIAEKFIDHRLFGSVFYISGNLYGFTGPVQFENTFSLNTPRVIQIAITSTLSSEKSKKAGAMGNYYVLDYAIFSVHGIVKNSLAKKTKATENDILRLYDGFWYGTKMLNTRSKFGQMPRLILGIVMKKPGYQIPGLRSLFDNSLISEEIRDIRGISLNLATFKEIIEKWNKKINYIEYREDQILNYYIENKKFDSVTEISNEIDDCPQFISV
ncbi:MAG: type I CRISPR-associated protein Cas7 [Promethearchaeota archaeon]